MGRGTFKSFQISTNFSDDLDEKEVEIKLEISKKKGLLKKPVQFTDVDAKVDVDIRPNPDLWQFYIDTNPVHRSIQVSSMTSEHEVGTYLTLCWKKTCIRKQCDNQTLSFRFRFPYFVSDTPFICHLWNDLAET